MGDLQGLAMEEDRPFPLPSFAAPLCNPDPDSIRVETWVAAEDPAREVLNCIHPTLDSEEKRKDVIEYVQRLIRSTLGLEVFPYGSVPLKTYLPDGDIDLTALATPNVEESSPRDVLAVLQAEEHNKNSEFELKDTQFIDAEVKLVKCLVQDIVIDVSFNQLGGLCTLCFLEQVDRLVGKDHLFKRSIILIKAWCYYESRILGAHHGLISTYALETLVLYIFHVFNPSLNGPVGVLYRFLDYYSKFDWDNYCVSLDGPVCKASLPNLVLKDPVNQEADVLLKDEFLRNCLDMFTVPSRAPETNVRAFPQKYLNIIDPLKENNNLGRSVHRGNYYRIRSAFRFGARKLGRILELPTDKIGDEIKKFFTNTLQRHGPKYGPDAALILGTDGFGNLSTSSLSEAYYEDDMYSKFSNGDFDDYMSGMDDISTDANDLSSFRSLNLKNANEKSDSSSRSSQHSHSHSGIDSHNGLPHTASIFENGHLSESRASGSLDGKAGLELWMESGESELVDGCLCINNHENVSDNSSLDFRERLATGSVGTEPLNPLSDLTGDYDSHIRSLLYGQCCHGYALSAAVVRTSPPTSPYGSNKSWEAAAPFHPNSSCSQVNANDASMGQAMYPIGSSSTPAAAAFGWEERNKARGTGPYFPIANCSGCKERVPTRGRGRSRLPPVSNGQLQRPRVGSVETDSVLDVNANHEAPSPRDKSPRQGRGKPVSLGHSQSQKQQQQQPSKANASGDGTMQRKLEFGSFGPLTGSPSNVEASQSCLQSSKLVYGRKQERIGEKSFHLKNEDEFPPLSA